MPQSPLAEFQSRATSITDDARQRQTIREALRKYEVQRDLQIGRFQSWPQARAAASAIKYDAINSLDRTLDEFTSNAEAAGTRVFFASDAESARNYILSIAKRIGAKKIVKSKTMTGEEIHLNDALEKAGYVVAESDLGEYIVQLRKEAPYHFVFPAMHLTRHEISKLFEKELGTAPTDDPEALTMIARKVMRQIYVTADIGISGGNFAIAETGSISITENEGNARLTTSLPRVHIAIMGIEKVLPKLSDLALFLPLLASSGAGQPLTCYNTMITGPRQRGEADGPEEFHLVLLDNGRTALLADAEQRDALHCIRCGACLNVCPIYQNVGGHTYGTTYQGPIGSVITPHYRGLADWKHLSHASTLCGACTAACPVKIDIHHHLLHNRRNGAAIKPSSKEKLLWRFFAFTMRHPRLYRTLGRMVYLTQPLQKFFVRTSFDPLHQWTRFREPPQRASRTFKDYWETRTANRRHGGHG